MSAASKLSGLLAFNIALSRSLGPNAVKKNSFAQTDFINPTFIHKALDKLALDHDYQNTNIIEMNPGIGLFSSILHMRLKPRNHILLEPQPTYHQHLLGLRAKFPKMQLVGLDGYHWSTYQAITQPPTDPPAPGFQPGFVPPAPKTLPIEDGVNKDLLFVGNLTRNSEARRLLSQFIQTCFFGSWVQEFGRVRFIIIAPDADKERVLPHLVQGRARTCVMASTACNSTEVASSGSVRTGRGFQATTIANKVIKLKPLLYKTHEEKLRESITKIQERIDKYHEGAKPKGRFSYKEQMVRLEELYREYLSWRNQLPYSKGASYADYSYEELRAMYKDPSVEIKETFTDDQVSSYSEFEEEYLLGTTLNRQKKNSVQDEKFVMGLDPPFLQKWEERNASPIILNPMEDVYPHRAVALLDLSPKLIHPYFRHSEGPVANKRYLIYDWIVRSLFGVRAQSLKSGLKGMVTGGEYLLDEMPNGLGKVLADRRIRCLTTEDLVAVAQAWESWPFKPEESEWGGNSWSDEDIALRKVDSRKPGASMY